ncbi:uncharacterized protein TM35_000241580 [Trypanosoma theileri]|uniref:Uncharacterized protein n=1 Tax=Trypanosoma theileri TaxID=67003 RepID=A0A1X0NR37_9TRYP|nr:uncharacterized protein TM35_000241580 [Trypanosoma theileri]ORC87008.1 hypothetical protein TM35_000241580 [Trypanosoma theileri]
MGEGSKRMRESDLLEMRTLPKVFPQHPFARHTVGLGAGESATPLSAASSSNNLLGVKVLGIYCSRTTGTSTSKSGDNNANGNDDNDDVSTNLKIKEEKEISADEVMSNLESSGQQSSEKRHIYVRIQFDKVLIDTLPLEVMREKYPQVLIDFLLSTAVWT